MAIQPFATQIQAPQIQTASPINQMGQMMALRDAQQQNQLRGMQMGQLQREEADVNTLRGFDPNSPDYLENVTRINPKLGIELQAKRREAQKFELEKTGANLKNISDTLALYGPSLDAARTPERRLAVHDEMHRDPILMPFFAKVGASEDLGRQEIVDAGQSPATFAAFLGRTNKAFRDTQKQLNDAYYAAADERRAVAGEARAVTAAGEATARAEREAAGVQKPLTAAQEVTLRKDMGKSRGSVDKTVALMADVKKAVQDVRNSPGKEGATGLSGYVPSYPGSASSKTDQAIANLKGKITALGRAQASMLGAIGPMAVQEWKIVADQVVAFDPTKMDPSTLEEQLNNIEAAADSAATNTRDAYETTFGDYFEARPEFALKEQVKRQAGASGSFGPGGAVDTNNPLLK